MPRPMVPLPTTATWRTSSAPTTVIFRPPSRLVVDGCIEVPAVPAAVRVPASPWALGPPGSFLPSLARRAAPDSVPSGLPGALFYQRRPLRPFLLHEPELPRSTNSLGPPEGLAPRFQVSPPRDPVLSSPPFSSPGGTHALVHHLRGDRRLRKDHPDTAPLGSP